MKTSVLIVDDDENLIDGLKDILEDAGYSVQSAATGMEAMRRLANEPPAAIIADFHLPDTTGLQLAIQIRALDKRPAIILMTGMASGDLEGKEGRDAVHAILLKPVEPPALLREIRKAIESPRS
jgi:CheY-like chemotaxis protein